MNYKEGILAAITELNDRTGSSEVAIRHFMRRRMPANKKWLNNVFLRALKKLRLENEIYKNRPHSYKLTSPAMKKKIRLSKELHELCASESLSLESLNELFQRYGLAANNDWNIKGRFFHSAIYNISVDEEIIQLLLEYFPGALNDANNSTFEEFTPLQIACQKENISFNIIRLLIESSPDSLQIEHDDYGMPLHFLCRNHEVDKTAAIEILQLFLERFPEAVRHRTYEGNLPILFASSVRSVQFCHMLIQAYPESVRLRNDYGTLPLHEACLNNDVATVEYLYNLYPDAINQTSDEEERYATHDGISLYPIHCAILSHHERRYPNDDAADIVRFLMGCDPIVKSQKVEGKNLLHFACLLDLNVDFDYDDSDVEAGMRVIKAVYNADPGAIKDELFRSDLQRCREQVQSFIVIVEQTDRIYRLLKAYPSLVTNTDDSK